MRRIPGMVQIALEQVGGALGIPMAGMVQPLVHRSNQFPSPNSSMCPRACYEAVARSRSASKGNR